MGSSTEFKLAAIDERLAQILPLLNDISASAWFVHEGKLHYSKHKDVIAKLESWIARSHSILPVSVINRAAELNRRVYEWVVAQGTSATPADIAEDFHELQTALSACKASLLEENG
jgi:hypothetical protein